MKILASRHYLLLPIYRHTCPEEELRLLEITCEGSVIGRFLIPALQGTSSLAEIAGMTTAAYNAAIDIQAYAGKTLEIATELPDRYLLAVHQSDELPQIPAQSERPSIHYTAPYGWINDPNGLVYADGVWHLYYQHNPLGTQWMNLSWGHAVSTDLVHYTYVSDVMFPDEHGPMYSGCGFRNDRGALGLPEDALLFYYTAAHDQTRLSGEHSTQRRAYSLDGGRTLIKDDAWELPCNIEGNRDPQITWYDELGAYIMVLYLDGSRFAIYRSTDLNDWEQTQTLELPGMDECPNLFRVTAEDGRTMWAFTAAEGAYVLGDFDGRTFTERVPMQHLYDGEIVNPEHHHWLPYAAQVYSGTPGRTIMIPWLQIPNRSTCYTGALGLARELTLAEDEHGLYIRQQFVPEAADYVTEDDLGTHVDDAYIHETITEDGRFYIVEID